MSSRGRLILLSGVGGAGTTTLAAGTASALEGEGLVVQRVDASLGRDPDPLVIEHLSASLGRILSDVGADPVLPASWSMLPGVDLLSSLVRIVSALDDPGTDAVVVDGGDHRRARDLVALPAVLLRLLDAVLTPRLAMWRPAPGSAPTRVPTHFEALTAARSDLERMRQALAHPATTMRLVTTPEQSAVTRTADALAVFSLLGIAVDGIVMNRFPRASDGWPPPVVDRCQRALVAMNADADGVTVWKSTAKVRAVPKGRSAMGPLGVVRVLDAERLTVSVRDEEFDVDLPLAGPARSGAEVGIQKARLVLRYGDCLRWIDLPPVLQRCRATHATRTEGGLRVTFVPDPATWRQPAAS